jgi:hypothetical protein
VVQSAGRGSQATWSCHGEYFRRRVILPPEYPTRYGLFVEVRKLNRVDLLIQIISLIRLCYLETCNNRSLYQETS